MQKQDTQTTEAGTNGPQDGADDVKHIKKIEAKPVPETSVKTGLGCVPVGT